MSPALAGGFFTTIATWEALLAMGILLKGSFIIQELWGGAEKSLSDRLPGEGDAAETQMLSSKVTEFGVGPSSFNIPSPLCEPHLECSVIPYLCYCYLNSQLVSGFQSILTALWKHLESFQKALSQKCGIRISRLLSGHSFKIEIKLTQYTVNHVKTHKPGASSTFTG